MNNQRMIGQSGIPACEMSLGTWAIGGGTWWGDNDDQVSIRTIHEALDAGINWVDTARVYGFGHSEHVVGEAVRDRRSKVILSTKCGLQWYYQTGEYHFCRYGHEVYRDLRASAIRRDLEISLKELGTDYIDVLFTHWQCKTDGFTPIEETMGELLKMKKEGLIRAIGVSNVDVDHVKEYLKYGPVDVVQEKFSMLDRRIDTGLLKFCEENGITLQTYSPIEQGLLTGKISNDYVPKAGETRENKAWWYPENLAIANRMMSGWSDLTEKYHCSIANLVIKWSTMYSPAMNILCGARKPAQIEENAASLQVDLSREDYQRMLDDADAAIREAGFRSTASPIGTL